MSSVERRARVHAALGDPARLVIADALAIGDASPSEIADRLGMSSNLVAHHLGVLTDAGVITRSRSEHDRRRSYVRLRPDSLAAFGSPGFAVPRRVVFVCTRNSARSQLAAAVWRSRSAVPAASAGTEPAARVNPRAVRAARRHGLRLAAQRTASLDAVAADGDLLIAVCDHVHETLPAALTRLHWSVPDPVPVDTDVAFEAAFADISERIGRLVPAITVGGSRP
ncbi:ArsR family transcriptional regulator [Asanoa ferruginea]|uniref:ArsR family transcriptional regulator n=2 Tax=Asanoa ferruginea TaxID=53367 RepID=A0A3D9ZQY6_9ACTN|nr:ArsR family transcriptional regulator [Asanoa ferruginea]GIF52283.1 putative regulatory protein, ArsR family [Asanoa ferruginea]